MTEVKGYHAHVYYDPSTKPVAEKLRDAIVGKFAVEPGAFSDEPRGPHQSRSLLSSSGPKSSKTSCLG